MLSLASYLIMILSFISGLTLGIVVRDIIDTIFSEINHSPKYSQIKGLFKGKIRSAD